MHHATHSHMSSRDGDEPVASSSPDAARSSDTSYISSELHKKKATAGFKKTHSSMTLEVKKETSADAGHHHGSCKPVYPSTEKYMYKHVLVLS